LLRAAVLQVPQVLQALLRTAVRLHLVLREAVLLQAVLLQAGLLREAVLLQAGLLPQDVVRRVQRPVRLPQVLQEHLLRAADLLRDQRQLRRNRLRLRRRRRRPGGYPGSGSED
jgi:hypothetical protein